MKEKKDIASSCLAFVILVVMTGFAFLMKKGVIGTDRTRDYMAKVMKFLEELEETGY